MRFGELSRISWSTSLHASIAQCRSELSGSMRSPCHILDFGIGCALSTYHCMTSLLHLEPCACHDFGVSPRRQCRRRFSPCPWATLGVEAEHLPPEAGTWVPGQRASRRGASGARALLWSKCVVHLPSSSGCRGQETLNHGAVMRSLSRSSCAVSSVRLR